ncbi:P-loop containing nucleoside triphosphate hydrolase protein [Rhizophagus clarus]|uniref:P-loop containing nucleoside triphosphate hydrolase protein n=1 Tax=Rhizophagus clarus TaxID=94130 RepID=A0A8H3QZ83_9GLOM|nr:P-loop containing nucleoside triphosphate hydrolase protein [Rhizophagus clarus]
MRQKSKKDTGLGKAIIRDRFKGNTRPKDGDTFLHTTDLDDGASWTKLQSITQQRDLDEFLSTAQLAGTQFTAEKLNIKVVTNTYHNPFLLSTEKEKEVLARQEANIDRLVIPRRPKWDKMTTPSQLERNERDAFLQWRRDLAFLQEQDEFLLTPFERNLEDLEKYVKEVDNKKKNLLLINKADLLSANQRRIWADYLDSQGIRYIFFSAVLAQEKLDKEESEVIDSDNIDNTLESQDVSNDGNKSTTKWPVEKNVKNSDKNEDTENDASINFKTPKKDRYTEYDVDDNEKVRIETTTDLVSLLVAEAPDIKDSDDPNKKLTIGLVGYPNVGKSSTINALLGEKRVSVSSTPGKTKHFQTIHLSPSLVLCDCPGLVFPNFATTNADMVCNGVLPIDQLREYTGPVALVAQRIPKSVLEVIYGIKICTKSPEEGGNGIPTAEELLATYAGARGFTKSGHGNLDESRAARYILKDYVNGKLPFCHPPLAEISPREFNAELHNLKLYTKTKKTVSSSSTITHDDNMSKSYAEINVSTKSRAFDKSFFSNRTQLPKIKGKYGGEFSRVKLYSIHGKLDDNGKLIDEGGSPSSMISSKKHHKKGKRNAKNRGANGYDV